MSHLANDTYYNLGSKTFWFLFSKNSVTGFVFLIIALLLSIVRANFVSAAEMASVVRIGAWFSFLVAVVALLIAIAYSRTVYKNMGFTLTADALYLSRGVFTKEKFAIPYRQIQNIEIERTIGHQMLGISKFIILTAGLENENEKLDEPEGIVKAIDKEVAENLQIELLHRANIQKVIPMHS